MKSSVVELRGRVGLLDRRECDNPEWRQLSDRIRESECDLQLWWFRPFFQLDIVRRKLGYGHW